MAQQTSPSHNLLICTYTIKLILPGSREMIGWQLLEAGANGVGATGENTVQSSFCHPESFGALICSTSSNMGVSQTYEIAVVR